MEHDESNYCKSIVSLRELAIVILNYNSFENLKKCIDQLLTFNSFIHIIVVDNYSVDGSWKQIQDMYSSIDLIQTKQNGGYSVGNNIGIHYAIEKYNVKIVGIMNPDVIIPDVNILVKMCTILREEENYGIIGAMVRNVDGETQPNVSGWRIPSNREVILNHSHIGFLNKKGKKEEYNLIRQGLAQIDVIAGSFFLAKVDALRQVGYFDENVFLYNEENILGIKCKRKGIQELLCLDCYYFHNHDYSKEVNWPLRKRWHIANVGYKSRRYLIRQFYPLYLVPLLDLIEIINKIYILLGYLKSRIFM